MEWGKPMSGPMDFLPKQAAADQFGDRGNINYNYPFLKGLGGREVMCNEKGKSGERLKRS